MSDLTPAMQQYYDIKNEYNDCIIFFRMWDFYEMFWDDAEIAHKVLWINITSRNKNSKNPEKLAWIPYHAKEKYLPLLINAWYKVAIVEQVGDPILKWIVKREVVRVVTPATLNLEWDNYDNINNSNIIISISKNSDKFWLSILNLSSNIWQTWEFNSFEELSFEIYKLNPIEVILEKKLFSFENIKDVLQKKYSLNIYFFELKQNPKQKLLNHFQTKDLSCFWIEDKQEAIFSTVQLACSMEQKATMAVKSNGSRKVWWLMVLWVRSLKVMVQEQWKLQEIGHGSKHARWL